MKQNHANQKPVWILVLSMLITALAALFFSCKKSAEVSNTDSYISVDEQKTKIDVKGLNDLLNISQLNSEIKKNLDIRSFKYFSKSSDRLWVFALNKGALGFKSAKVAATLKDNHFSMILLSFDYDESAYVNGDFSTYSGTTAIYDEQLQKTKELLYQRGKLRRITIANCPTCSMCYDCSVNHNWCVEFPPLCNYWQGSGDGEALPPAGWELPPDGGGSTYSNVVIELGNILSPDLTQWQGDWLEQHLARAFEIYFYLQNSSDPNKKQISLSHLDRMRFDGYYLNFVINHADVGDATKIWWEDNMWLIPFGGIDFGHWAINYLNLNPNVAFTTFQNQFMTSPEGQDGTFDATFWDDPNLTFTHQNLPTWVNFESHFPKRSDPLYDTPAKLYASIGGDVLSHTNAYSNTCAARVSKALNYSGVTIPNISEKTYQGSDGKYYFLGAENLNRWMRKTFGCANPNTAIGEYSNTNSLHYNANEIGTNGENLPTLLSGIKGIYSMVSNDYTWATGHADLLNPGSTPTCDGGCHFDGPVRYIDVWKLQ
jgi:hypothetical protein